MKKLLGIAFSTSLLLFSSCTKSTVTVLQSVTVIKDCTGNYLRLDGKDYRVCNRELLKDYPDGSRVMAAFNKIDTCTNNLFYACTMVHSYPVGPQINVDRIASE